MWLYHCYYFIGFNLNVSMNFTSSKKEENENVWKYKKRVDIDLRYLLRV